LTAEEIKVVEGCAFRRLKSALDAFGTLSTGG